MLLYFASPAISVFFKEPILVEVTRVIGWVLIINALAIIPRTQFVREVDFKTQTKVSLISSISSGVIGIGMALGGMGVWSLVGQQLSRQFLNTLFLWIYSKWHPVWEFSTKSFKELFGLDPNYYSRACWTLFIKISIISSSGVSILLRNWANIPVPSNSIRYFPVI